MIVGLAVDMAGITAAVRAAPGAPVEIGVAEDLAQVLRATVSSCVVAVPDHWLDGRAAGVRQADWWRRALDAAGVADPEFVGRSVACAVACGRRGDAVVYDLADHRVTASVLRDGDVADSVTETPSGETGVLGRLVTEAAVAANARRAAVVLARAGTTTRYRKTPIYQTFTAGEVLDAWAPIAASARRCLGALTARSPHAGELPTIRIGTLAAVPLTDPPAAESPAPSAVAEGALRLSESAARTPRRYRHRLDLPAHRVHHGLLRSDRLAIAVPGDPAPSWVRRATPPVEVPPGGSGPLVVEWTTSADATPVVLPLSTVPPGTYHVRVWPSYRGPGVLGWFPVDGGPPHFTEPAS